MNILPFLSPISQISLYVLLTLIGIFSLLVCVGRF